MHPWVAQNGVRVRTDTMDEEDEVYSSGSDDVVDVTAPPPVPPPAPPAPVVPHPIAFAFRFVLSVFPDMPTPSSLRPPVVQAAPAPPSAPLTLEQRLQKARESKAKKALARKERSKKALSAKYGGLPDGNRRDVTTGQPVPQFAVH